MSATIPETMRLDDLLKATGYDCPQSLQGKTFDQATEGEAELEDNKTVSITENGVVEITPSEGKDGMKKVTATVNVSGGGSGGNILYAWYNEYPSPDGDDWKRYLYTYKENFVNGENVNCLVIDSGSDSKILKRNCIFQQAFSDSKVAYPCIKIGSKFYKTNGASLSNEVETTCPIPSSEYVYINAIKVVEVEGVTYYVDTDNNIIKTGSTVYIGMSGVNEILTYLRGGTTVSDTSLIEIINDKIINNEYEEPILTSYLSGATHYDWIGLYYFTNPIYYFFYEPRRYIRDNESDVE